MHVGSVDPRAEHGMAVVVTSQQHVDAGLSFLIAVPVIHPVVRHLQDAKIRDRTDTIDRLKCWFAIDLGAAQSHRLEAKMW